MSWLRSKFGRFWPLVLIGAMLFVFMTFATKQDNLNVYQNKDGNKLPLYKYNNGLAKGSVNKIKLTKRIMYGRNSFELLKAKLLLKEIQIN